jgi:hypothetical protein
VVAAGRGFAAVNLLLASHRGAALAAYYPVHGGRLDLSPAADPDCRRHSG